MRATYYLEERIKLKYKEFIGEIIYDYVSDSPDNFYVVT